MLPDGVVHETDERVSSFWVDGERVLLQLSSYKTFDGSPISAQQRLRERIGQSCEHWTVWECNPLGIAGTEQAIAETTDANGLLWVHAYIVWPHLTVYATVSGPPDKVRSPRDWTVSALKSIVLVVQ